MTTIHVTRKHIDEGLMNNCDSCPVALAIAEKVRAEVHVAVGEYIRFYGDVPRIVNILTPHSAEVFIRRFDRGRLVQPFSFDLDIKPELLREVP